MKIDRKSFFLILRVFYTKRVRFLLKLVNFSLKFSQKSFKKMHAFFFPKGVYLFKTT